MFLKVIDSIKRVFLRYEVMRRSSGGGQKADLVPKSCCQEKKNPFYCELLGAIRVLPHPCCLCGQCQRPTPIM